MSAAPYPFRGVRPSEIKMVYTFRCGECGDETTEEVLGEYFAPPKWPEGWSQLVSDAYFSPTWVCPKHRVTVLVESSPIIAIPSAPFSTEATGNIVRVRKS